MASRVQQLSRAYRTLQKMDADTIEVALREDCIDKWEDKYHYPDYKLIILYYEFHLVEDLPPTVTTAFPPSSSFVSFQELGKNTWNGDCDVLTIIFALQTEMASRARVFGASGESVLDATE